MIDKLNQPFSIPEPITKSNAISDPVAVRRPFCLPSDPSNDLEEIPKPMFPSFLYRAKLRKPANPNLQLKPRQENKNRPKNCKWFEKKGNAVWTTRNPSLRAAETREKKAKKNNNLVIQTNIPEKKINPTRPTGKARR